MVTEITGHYSVNPSLNFNPGLYIFQLVEPILVGITARRGEVMADFHLFIIAYKRMFIKGAQRE